MTFKTLIYQCSPRIKHNISTLSSSVKIDGEKHSVIYINTEQHQPEAVSAVSAKTGKGMNAHVISYVVLLYLFVV